MIIKIIFTFSFLGLAKNMLWIWVNCFIEQGDFIHPIKLTCREKGAAQNTLKGSPQVCDKISTH
jgi:hypothetical protein